MSFGERLSVGLRRDAAIERRHATNYPVGVATSALKDYFTTLGQRRALEAYSEFAKGTAWSVPLKMDLYDLSREAFTATGSLPAFERIYNNLVSYWQVFRPHGADECWNAAQIFEAVRRELVGFDHASGVSLANFDNDKRHSVMFSLMALEGMKPNAGYPTMTVSKFLHFYNPSLFPIYDTAVVWNKVFARFSLDYRAFCNAVNLDPSADGAAFLRNYVCWASSLMADAGPGFMSAFVAWLEDELPRKRFAALDQAFLRTLYATAFEFTAIGAAKAEGF
jgi:hypothetical protein